MIDVLAIYAAELEKGKSPREAFQGTRTEVHAAYQLEHPFPGPEDVTDDDRIRSDHARKQDPSHLDALHWLQKEYGKALWKMTDRLIRDAGITEQGRSS